MVKAVCFDCWNTLFYAERRPPALRALSTKVAGRQIAYPLLKRFERAIMTAPESDAAATARKLLRSFGLPALPPLVRQAQRGLQDAVVCDYPDTFEVLERLHGRYKLAIISNTFQTAFDPVRQDHRLDTYFDVVTTSYEAGVLKPEPQIFRHTLAQLGVRPEEAVMVGDNPRDDVAAAEAMGMTGVLLDRGGRHPGAPRRIESLAELPALLSKL